MFGSSLVCTLVYGDVVPVAYLAKSTLTLTLGFQSSNREKKKNILGTMNPKAESVIGEA